MQFRVARHTNKIEEISEFYTKIIGLEILGDFKNHSNYDGIFIGKPYKDWHLEFTTTHEEVNHQFDEDDCLVFYPESQYEYDAIIERLEINQIEIIISKNPYWNTNGISIKDPDGFVVIISSIKINEE